MSVTVTGDGPSIALTGTGSAITITVTTGSSSGGGVTDHGALTGLADDDHTQYAQKANNLSDLTDAATARTNLGLGTAATSATGDFAAASHNHAASAITSGTVDTARLGSGTADGTTFLRGDQTWATPAGGSVATDAIWDAAGDLVYGTGSDTATRLALGTNGQILTVGMSGPEWDTRRLSGTSFVSRSVTGAVSETINPNIGSFGTVNPLVSGRMYLCGIYLPKNTTITSISFCTSTGAISGATHQWFTLCDGDGVTLRSTVDDTSTGWFSNQIKTLALSSTFTTTYSGLHYVGCCVVASTVNNLRGIASTGAVGVFGETFHSTTGLTDPVADGTTLTRSTGASITAWAAVA